MSFGEKYTLLLIGMGGSMIMARLLTPAQIGVFSIGAVVVGISQLIRDFGVGQYLIQERQLDSGKLRAAFTLTLAIAWTLAVALWLLSGPIGRFYGESGVSAVLRVLALNCLLIPFGSVTLPVLRRRLRFGALYCINVTGALVNFAVCAALALAGFGVLSLAWAAVAGTGATVLASLAFRPRDMPWRPGLAGMRPLLSFGAYATGSNVLDESGVAAPDLIIGKVIGAEGVGLFGKAQGVLNIFNLLVTRAITPVIQPLYAAQARGGHDMKQAYLKTIRYMTALSWPFFAVLAVLALPLLRLLYGPQWDASAPLVRIMCLSAATFSLFGMARDLFVAMGHVRKRAQLEMMALPLRVLGIVVAAPFGLEAVAWSIVLSTLAKALLIYRGLAELTGLRLREVGAAVAKGGALVVLVLPPPLLALQAQACAPLALLLGGAGAGLCWLAGVFLLKHEIGDDVLALRRRPAVPR